MKKPNHLDLPDEFFLVAPDDGKSICAGELNGATYFLDRDTAITHAVELASEQPAVIFQCKRQLKVMA